MIGFRPWRTMPPEEEQEYIQRLIQDYAAKADPLLVSVFRFADRELHKYDLHLEITSFLRKKGVHSTGRAGDGACKGLQRWQCRMIEAAVNEAFPRKDRWKTCIWHDVDGTHFHFQVAPAERKKKVDLIKVQRSPLTKFLLAAGAILGLLAWAGLLGGCDSILPSGMDISVYDNSGPVEIVVSDDDVSTSQGDHGGDILVDAGGGCCDGEGGVTNLCSLTSCTDIPDNLCSPIGPKACRPCEGCIPESQSIMPLSWMISGQ